MGERRRTIADARRKLQAARAELARASAASGDALRVVLAWKKIDNERKEIEVLRMTRDPELVLGANLREDILAETPRPPISRTRAADNRAAANKAREAATQAVREAAVAVVQALHDAGYPLPQSAYPPEAQVASGPQKWRFTNVDGTGFMDEGPFAAVWQHYKDRKSVRYNEAERRYVSIDGYDYTPRTIVHWDEEVQVTHSRRSRAHKAEAERAAEAEKPLLDRLRKKLVEHLSREVQLASSARDVRVEIDLVRGRPWDYVDAAFLPVGKNFERRRGATRLSDKARITLTVPAGTAGALAVRLHGLRAASDNRRVHVVSAQVKDCPQLPRKTYDVMLVEPSRGASVKQVYAVAADFGDGLRVYTPESFQKNLKKGWQPCTSISR